MLAIGLHNFHMHSLCSLIVSSSFPISSSFYISRFASDVMHTSPENI
jgi:hypothetical protein